MESNYAGTLTGPPSNSSVVPSKESQRSPRPGLLLCSSTTFPPASPTSPLPPFAFLGPAENYFHQPVGGSFQRDYEQSLKESFSNLFRMWRPLGEGDGWWCPAEVSVILNVLLVFRGGNLCCCPLGLKPKMEGKWHTSGLWNPGCRPLEKC